MKNVVQGNGSKSENLQLDAFLSVRAAADEANALQYCSFMEIFHVRGMDYIWCFMKGIIWIYTMPGISLFAWNKRPRISLGISQSF